MRSQSKSVDSPARSVIRKGDKLVVLCGADADPTEIILTEREYMKALRENPDYLPPMPSNLWRKLLHAMGYM